MRPIAALSTLALLLVVAPAARAEYALPEVADRYVLVVDDWSIEAGAECEMMPDGTSVMTERTVLAEGDATWTIDLFWLADRIDSDSICTGDHRKSMEEYLGRVGRDAAGRRLVVELVTTKAGGRPFVAGLWPLGAGEAFDGPARFGGRLLDLTGDDLDGGAIVARLEERSAADRERLAR